MTKHNLYHVQDPDRPMWVIAENMGHAVERWQEVVAAENEQKVEDVGEPAGCHFVCETADLLLP